MAANKTPKKPKKTLQQQLDDVLEIADDSFEDFDASEYEESPVSVIPVVSTNVEIAKTSENSLDVMESPKKDFRQDFVDDYDTTRKTLQNLINKGTRALDSIIELAQEGDSPRSYEVVGQLIKITSDVAKDLLNLQKTVNDIQKNNISSDEEGNKPTGPTTNNIENAVIFSGTTEDALRKIKQLQGNQ